MYATEYRLNSLDQVIMTNMSVHEYRWLQLSVTGEYGTEWNIVLK